MIWALGIVVLIVIGWYTFEGWWDRRLFRSGQDRICANIHPAKARAFLDSHPGTQVIDVRSRSEFAGGALPGAVNVPLGDMAFDHTLDGLDPKLPVLVYCAGGFRSRKAVPILMARGFTNIQHLHRGFHSWKLAGLPVTTRDGA